MKGTEENRPSPICMQKGQRKGPVLLIWRWATLIYSVKHSWEAATFHNMFQIPTKGSEHGC